MNKKPDNTTLIATAAVTLAAAATTYMFFKAYKTIQTLEELELDFGNDEGILSMFTRKDTK
jgi:hypothetical protein